ncbi:M48 family metalloprotease [Candidatus Fermentibacteria bacterium]|nr:M48 family metalloprotease [Candidatus Fermentibacteria bacterium]
MTTATLLLAMSLVAFGLGDVADVVTSDDVSTAIEVGTALSDAAREITESEEYFIGRAVAANILYRYDSVQNDSLQQYLNMVGTAVACFSPRPTTYGGYHFLLLDSEEINAMACPGGLIFVTRGLFDLAESEDELAGILAHEVAHVALEHGLRSVEKAKMVGALSLMGTEAAERWGSDQVREISEQYGDVVEDITSNLVTKGYSRESEKQADSLAVNILDKSGYDPNALERVLERMSLIDERSGPGFWQTHPSPEDRLEVVAENSSGADYDPTGEQARNHRFQLYISSKEGSADPRTEESGGREGSGGRRGSGGR